MPLQNRVMPDGALVADPARGTLMGNRGGRFHDPASQKLTHRRWASRQWICCALQFRNRHREVWSQSYTELFFCDEVSALSAGHRPCFECRRADALSFAEAVQRGLDLAVRPSAALLDAMLDAERRMGRLKRDYPMPGDSLPDGSMIVVDGKFFARRHNQWQRWRMDGYSAADLFPPEDARVLTPPTVLAALRAGYRARWHESATQL